MSKEHPVAKTSLRYRIAVIIFVLEGVMVSLVLWQSQSVSLESALRQHKAFEHVVLEMLSHPGRTALINNKYYEFQPYVEAALEDSQVVKVVLVDNRGRVVFSSDPTLLGKEMLPVVYGEQEGWHGEDLSNSSGPLGRLDIQFSRQDLIQAHRSALTHGLTIGLSSMVFIAVVGIIIGYLLTRRLGRLKEAASRMARGDLDVVVKQAGSDEVAELSRDFNTMAQVVTKQMKELESHRDNLEAMVALRTTELQQALDEVNTLQGIIPICSFCKQVRDDSGYWKQVEVYVRDHSEADFSHGVCPDCMSKHYPEYADSTDVPAGKSSPNGREGQG